MLLPVFLSISHCQTTGIAETSSGATFCQIAKPITWSRNDTRPTQEQVVEHNLVHRTLCGAVKK